MREMFVVVREQTEQDCLLHKNNRPSIVHYNLEIATNEAVRLATENPGKIFAVLGIIGRAVTPVYPAQFVWGKK